MGGGGYCRSLIYAVPSDSSIDKHGEQANGTTTYVHSYNIHRMQVNIIDPKEF
jgi:hypothetical protein